MSTRIKSCPKCEVDAKYAKVHCQTSPTCTWATCWKCGITFDRVTGNFPKVAA